MASCVDPVVNGLFVFFGLVVLFVFVFNSVENHLESILTSLLQVLCVLEVGSKRGGWHASSQKRRPVLKTLTSSNRLLEV